MLQGVDFSHWQQKELDKEITKYDFIIHKLSEGSTNIDNECYRRFNMFPDKPRIVYHFAHKNNFDDGLRNFGDAFTKLPTPFQIGMAIDLEAPDFTPQKHGDTIEAIKKWSIFTRGKGKRGIVYISDIMPDSVYQTIREYDLGLWIARYRIAMPEHQCDFWQYTSDPYDKNNFYGDMVKLKSFLLDKSLYSDFLK